jgi:hypothetical protein
LREDQLWSRNISVGERFPQPLQANAFGLLWFAGKLQSVQ